MGVPVAAAVSDGHAPCTTNRQCKGRHRHGIPIRSECARAVSGTSASQARVWRRLVALVLVQRAETPEIKDRAEIFEA
eukprot:scaffold10065_cov111-Isochrysis_galbana.AAC.3